MNMECTRLDSTDCIKMNGEILLELTKTHFTKMSDVTYLWDLLSKISLQHNCIPVTNAIITAIKNDFGLFMMLRLNVDSIVNTPKVHILIEPNKSN